MSDSELVVCKLPKRPKDLTDLNVNDLTLCVVRKIGEEWCIKCNDIANMSCELKDCRTVFVEKKKVEE